MCRALPAFSRQGTRFQLAFSKHTLLNKHTKAPHHNAHLNCTLISAPRVCRALPAFSRKGTPSQRALLMCRATAAKVGHKEFLGTVSSSK